MNRAAKRRLILVIVLLLVAAAVALDRTRLLRASDEASPRATYARVAQQVEQQRVLIQSRDEIDRELAELESVWQRFRPGLIVVPTRELAPAALRDRVRQELVSAGVRDLRVLGEEFRSEATVPGRTATVLPMRIRVSFEVEDSQLLYHAIDRLEHSEALLARVGSISVRGGGLNDAVRRLTVTLSVDAAALISEVSP